MQNVTNIKNENLAVEIANCIFQGFVKHYQLFTSKTLEAKIFFECANGVAEQNAIKDRIAFYDERIHENILLLENQFGIENLQLEIWQKIKLYYLDLLIDCFQPELAETFFNSVVCRILHRDYFHNKYIFRRPLISLEYINGTSPSYDCYYPHTESLRKIIQKILKAPKWNVPFLNLAQDVSKILILIANVIGGRGTKWPKPEYNCQIQVLHSPFYQNTAAYLIGKLINGAAEYPFTIVIRTCPNPKAGNDILNLYIDALILDPLEIRKMFSLSRAYFMVAMEVPSTYVRFLRTIMPGKPRAEIYTMLGLGKQGKTVFYRDLIYHLKNSNDKFIIAPGIAGLVMVVFMLPSFPFVFKIIRDKFGSSKNVDHSTVREKYTLVKQVDRVGRMADTLEFSYVALPINRFEPSLIETLKESIPSLLEFENDTVVIKHLYIERRMEPLNIFIARMEAEGKMNDLENAVNDYGNAIRELAEANIFPGDMLWKNFGITRYGRVVFYDYDEIEFMTSCNFRNIPECPYPEMEMSGEPWYSVGKNDIFPEEFEKFILGSTVLKKFFLKNHRELLTAQYWQNVQTKIRQGKVIEHFPYSQNLRFINYSFNKNSKYA